MRTRFCSQLEACNSSQVASKQKKTKCGPHDRHLWLLAAVASRSCASGFLSRMCSRFPLLAARPSGQQAVCSSSNPPQRLSIQLVFNNRKNIFLWPRNVGINIRNQPHVWLLMIKLEDWLKDTQEECAMEYVDKNGAKESADKNSNTITIKNNLSNLRLVNTFKVKMQNLISHFSRKHLSFI